MPLTQIPDIAYELLEDGDTVRLEQSTGCGEATSLDLHRIHLEHLAGLMNIQSSARGGLDYRAERALFRLWQKIDLLTSDCYLDEIVSRCGEGLAYQANAYDARALLQDLLEDLGIEVEVEEPEAARAACNENPVTGNAITVTPQRGRPATGEAMTNAERQARHRAKQADLLEAAA